MWAMKLGHQSKTTKTTGTKIKVSFADMLRFIAAISDGSQRNDPVVLQRNFIKWIWNSKYYQM